MFRIVVLGLFVIAILFFFLPWVNLSCLGEPVVTVNGFDMVVGKEYDVPSGFGSSSGNRTEIEPLAIGVLAMAVLGVAVAIIRWKYAFVLRIILGLSGIALLIALKFKFDRQINEQGQGIIRINYLVGYWLTLVTFAISATMGLFKEDFKPRFKITINDTKKNSEATNSPSDETILH